MTVPAYRTSAPLGEDVPLVVGLPSKGRLMEKAAALFAAGGHAVRRIGSDRGYRGTIEGLENVEVAFLSASEIARHLRNGKIDAGITGEDLLQETIPDWQSRIEILISLGFGHANVVVAVPESWLDCATMDDLEEIAEEHFQRHGRRLRVATKYLRLTRQFFANKGIAGYRTVLSSGATEGAPAAGTAEVIVDITSTGSTLRANHLKVLEDGIILRSQAVFAARLEKCGDPRMQILASTLKSALRNEQ